MSARGFRSVFMVASCAGAALGCYLVSLRVASERAALEQVEARIVMTQRDIRLLQTEIGTRGRLAQLERWNVKVLALSAPSADQFLDGGFALAKMVAPQNQVDLEAPVVLASQPANAPKAHVEGTQERDRQPDEGVSASQMLHVASLKREVRPEVEKIARPARPEPAKPIVQKAADKPVATAKAGPKPPTVAKATTAKAKPAVERKTIASDPLAPIAAAKPSKLAATTAINSGKDSGRKQ
jgi:hypothetical protein